MYKILLLAVVCSSVHSYEDKTCKIPNGDAGRCVNIIRCKPLWDIHNKKRKTLAEDTFIRQSFCGFRNSPTLYVCCPSAVIWPAFAPNPVIYHNPLDDLSGDTYYPTTEVNAIKEIKEVNKTSDILNISTSQSDSTPIPITTITETELKINEVIPLSRDTPNLTVTNNDDAFKSLKVSNRNNKNTCGEDDAYGGNRITGGDATSIDEYPWLALLEYRSGALGCGGSLITSRFVLTAAHCANSRANGIPAFVRLSEYNTTSFPTDIVEVDGGGFEVINVTVIPVENVWQHPNFTQISFVTDATTPFSNDIGLVKLTEDVEFKDFIDIICLPYKDFISELNEGTYFSVAGWGDDKLKTDYNDVKKHVAIPYVPLEKCRTVHSRNLVDSQICAGGEKDKDSCVGDSGGPLMYTTNKQFYLVGIVSYGSVFCGTKGQPGIYTDVYKHLKWINDIISTK